MSLRDLDERWLPRAAARARGWAERLDVLRARGATAVEGLALDRMDERWAARGPLLGLRRRPGLGLVLVAVLLAAGVVAAVDQERTPRHRPLVPVPTATPTYQGSGGATLGPPVGTDVGAYVRAVTEGLVRADQTAPRGTRVALVSLSNYLTPEGVQTVLAGYTAARVYVRAPDAGRAATPFTVEVHGDVLTALRVAYAQTAKTRLAAATAYQTYVNTLKGTSQQDKTFRDLYTAFAKASAIEAQQYAGDCACVYSALVQATPSQLLLLQARPGVRAVEVASEGVTVAQVQVQPLQPEVTGRVPAPSAGGLR